MTLHGCSDIPLVIFFSLVIPWAYSFLGSFGCAEGFTIRTHHGGTLFFGEVLPLRWQEEATHSLQNVHQSPLQISLVDILLSTDA